MGYSNKHCWSCKYWSGKFCPITNKPTNSNTKACKQHKLSTHLKGIKGGY